MEESGKKTTEVICVVCLEELKLEDYVCELHCGHIFHPTCAHKWLCEDWRCPFRCALAPPQPPKAVGVGASDNGSAAPDAEMGSMTR